MGEPQQPSQTPPPKRRRRWMWILLTLAFVLGTGIAATSVYLYNHVRSDPTFCTNCHAIPPAWKDWERSPHRHINCHTCHRGDLLGNLKQLWRSPEGGGAPVKHGEVDQKACETCHSSGDRWKRIEATGGHRVHVVKANIPCLRCHGATEHVKRPPEKICIECHRSIAVTLDKMSSTHCLSCHNYLAKSEGLAPAREQCLRCHATMKSAHDFEKGTHNEIACARCHMPHAPRKPGEGSVLRTECAACHADPVGQTTKAVATIAPARPAPSAPAKSPPVHLAPSASATFAEAHGACRTCHEPHGPRREAHTQCARCHAEKTPQLRTAGHRDCVGCHKPHEWTALPGRAICATCHQKKVETASQVTPAHQNCRTCHTPHLKQTARSRCRDCHEAVATAVSREPRVHGECTVCHKPHRPPKEGDASCADCHGQRVHGSTAHARCSQCHTPHALSARKARTACATCHGGQAKRVATSAAPHAQCATCHAPHADPKLGARACTDCHGKQIHATRGVHKDCKQCHEPHAIDARKARASCGRCHGDELRLVQATGGPHTRCTTCHAPHAAMPGATSATCASCHRRETRRSVAKGGAHADCKSCHEAHQPRAPGDAVCSKCHREVHEVVTAVAKPAPHGRCSSCHPAHELRPSGAAACRSCHAPQATAAVSFVDTHPAALGTHGGCRTCHAYHGNPKTKPPCTKCHGQVREKKTLHAVNGHARCGDCHATHDPQVSGRAKCVSCHTKQRNHVPGATECKGCHLFR